MLIFWGLYFGPHFYRVSSRCSKFFLLLVICFSSESWPFRFQRAVLQCSPFSRVLLVQLPDTEQGQRTRQQLDMMQQQLCQQQFLHQQQQQQQPICQQQLWRNNQPQHFQPHINQHQLQPNQFQQNHVQTYGRPLQSVGEVQQQQMPPQQQPPPKQMQLQPCAADWLSADSSCRRPWWGCGCCGSCGHVAKWADGGQRSLGRGTWEVQKLTLRRDQGKENVSSRHFSCGSCGSKLVFFNFQAFSIQF